MEDVLHGKDRIISRRMIMQRSRPSRLSVREEIEVEPQVAKEGRRG